MARTVHLVAERDLSVPVSIYRALCGDLVRADQATAHLRSSTCPECWNAM